jgi:hypothetical protein
MKRFVKFDVVAFVAACTCVLSLGAAQAQQPAASTTAASSAAASAASGLSVDGDITALALSAR